MSRSTAISGVIAALLLAGGCRQQQQPPPTDFAQEPAVNRPALIRPSAPLDREALLSAVAQAASAAAAGAGPPEALRNLDGRQFELRIRFGCRGPSAANGKSWLNFTYDTAARSVRVQARPTISASEPIVEAIAGRTVEAVEGFWLPRPWLLHPTCPAAAASTPVAAEAGGAEPAPGPAAVEEGEQDAAATTPRVGIAQFFTEADSRTGRRDNRPYEAVHDLSGEQAAPARGYTLVLSGRLRALPDRGVIACVARDPDSPPDCIISAEFQRAWIEHPDTREVIAEWGRG